MEIPRELVKQFARGNGAVFIGAGLSMGIGLPSWANLMRRLMVEIEGCPTDTFFQDIAQYYEIANGRQLLISHLREELDTFDLKLTHVHEELVKLPVNYIFTTNYDNLLEQSLTNAGRKFDVVVSSVDAGFWDSDRVQLVKLHGDLSQPESIVITAADYESYFDNHPALTRLLAVALQTRTVLFLGYSTTDPDFRQLLTQVRNEAGRLPRNSFAVFLNADKWKIRDLEQRAIRVINLAISDNQNETETNRRQHCNQVLAKWLNELNRQIQPRQQSKQATFHQQPLPSEPYKFLDYFTSDDAAIFHGRERETDRLISLILTYPLSILYGDSGTGKTSLLKASVLPYLKTEGYHVAYARPLSDPLQEVQNAILEVLNNGLVTRKNLISLRSVIESNLPTSGHLLIILDQFEEFFIRQGRETRRQFIRELVDSLNTPEREVRCLLSLRSEYLHRLDELELPQGRDPLRNRMRLYDLGPAGASAAIEKPAFSFGIKLEHALLEQLLTDLKQVDIAPPQLQIVCYVLWQDWKKHEKFQSGLTLQRYRELGGTSAILADYLDNVIGALEQPEVRYTLGLTLESDKVQEAVRTVLKSMITSERTKVAISGREIAHIEIINKLGIDPPQAETLLSYLKNKRIIRNLPDSDHYELAHEVMIEKVWEWVDEDELKILELQDMLARATSDYRKFQSLLPLDRLNLLTEHATKLSLNDDALKLLLESAIEYNLDPSLWVSKMDSDRAIEVLVTLLEMRKRKLYPQIAKALGYTHSPKVIRYLLDLLRNESDEVQRAAATALGKLGLSAVARPLYYAIQKENKLTRAARIIDALELLHNDEAASMLMLIASEHNDSHVRTRATNVLLGSGYKKGIRLIVRQLNSDDPMIRQNAIEALKKNLEKNLDELDAMLHDADPQVRQDTVEALTIVNDKRRFSLLVQAFQDNHAEVRQKAVNALGKLGYEPAVEILHSALRDDDTSVRREAVRVLGELRDNRAIEMFQLTLKDDDVLVRQETVKALAKLEDKRAKEILFHALRDDNAAVRREVVDAMGRLCDDQTLDYLLTTLGDQNAEVRQQAVSALGKLSSDRALPSLCFLILHDDDANVRREAVGALEKFQDINAFNSLMAALQDQDVNVRQEASDVLKRLSESVLLTKGDNRLRLLATRAFGAVWKFHLLIKLGSENVQERREAVIALGKIRDKRTVEPLVAAMRDDDFEVRRQAANALGSLRDDRSLEPLITALQYDEDFLVRSNCAKSLGDIGNRRAVESLIVALQSPNPEVRRNAAQSLGYLSDQRAVIPLITALKDKDMYVRCYSVVALSNLIDERFSEPLIETLKDEIAMIRRESALALGKLGDKRALQPLLGMVQDDDAEVRQEVIRAIIKLKGIKLLLGIFDDEESKVDQDALLQMKGTLIVERLAKLLDDQDVDVRREVAKAFGQIGSVLVINHLTEALQDHDREVRLEVARALANIPDIRVIKPLLSVLRDKDAAIQEEANSALEKLADAGLLQSALLDHDPKMRLLALVALGNIWKLPVLIQLGSADPGTRQGAAEALGKLGDVRAVEPLLTALHDEEIRVRLKAIKALKNLEEVVFAKSLREALRNEDVNVRRQTANNLETLTNVHAINPWMAALQNKDFEVCQQVNRILIVKRVVEPLLIALRDKDAEVHIHATRLLQKMEGIYALELLFALFKKKNADLREQVINTMGQFRCVQLLKVLLRDESPQVRQLTAYVLGKLGDIRAVEALQTALQDSDTAVRFQTVCALEQLKHIGPLIAVLRDDDVSVRRKAVITLGKLGNLKVVNPLITALRDDDAEVRQRTASALGKLGDKRAIEPLLDLLQDEDLSVQRHAAIALGRLKDKRAVEPLLDALVNGDIDVRLSAAIILGQLRDMRALNPLRSALSDSNLQLREAAMKALIAMGDNVEIHQ